MRRFAAFLLVAGVVLGAAGSYFAEAALSAWGFGAAVLALIVWFARAVYERRAASDGGDAPAFVTDPSAHTGSAFGVESHPADGFAGEGGGAVGGGSDG